MQYSSMPHDERLCEGSGSGHHDQLSLYYSVLSLARRFDSALNHHDACNRVRHKGDHYPVPVTTSGKYQSPQPSGREGGG